jgi:hypothetical protein
MNNPQGSSAFMRSNELVSGGPFNFSRDADKFYSPKSGGDELASHSPISGGITATDQKYSSSRRGRVNNLYSVRRDAKRFRENVREHVIVSNGS